MGAIGRWALREACRQRVEWGRNGQCHDDLAISVNLSPLQLRDPSLVADVADILHRTGLPADRLRLEVTESAAPGAGEDTLRRLADLGVGLALGDFGTGFSSLAALSRLPVTNAKLAAEFLAPGCSAPSAGPGAGGSRAPAVPREVLRHVVALCHSLGMTVTAEGVETADQDRMLRELGCDDGQGFHFARPAAADQIGTMLRR